MRTKGKGWEYRVCKNCGAGGLSKWNAPPGVRIFIGPCCRASFGGIVR